MKDQAERLRSLVHDTGTISNQLSAARGARVISITSGKGGVGKTTLAVNLALAAQISGLSTLLFDADLGLGNVDIALGVYPRHNLMHVLRQEKTIADIIYTGPEGLRLIAGGSGWAELANLTDLQLASFIDGLSEVGDTADLILFDTGAGISPNVLSFLHASQEIMVVTTPEPTSITDAYAVIKQIDNRADKKIYIVVNRVRNSQEAIAIYEKIARTAARFLGANLTFAGWLPEDATAVQAIISQQAILLHYQRSNIAAGINRLGEFFFAADGADRSLATVGLRSFFARLTRFLGA